MKKAISPVVATALLLVVAVVAVVGFNTWFNQYQSNTLSGVEQSSQNSNSLEIDNLIGSTLYIKNPTTSNLSLNTVKIAGKSCTINQNFGKGSFAVNVSACMNNTVGIVDVVIVSNTSVKSKKIFLKNSITGTSSVSIPSGCHANTPEGFNWGSGTIGDPWQVCNCTQLQKLSNYVSSNFILTAAIDCTMTPSWSSGSGFLPIGNVSVQFRGTLNGKGYTINGLKISRMSATSVGLFGMINQSTIKNISLTNVIIMGDGSVGGIAGRMYQSTISNAQVSGTNITSKLDGGGIVGTMLSNTLVANSSSNIPVLCARNCGGSVGLMDGTVSSTKLIKTNSLNNVYAGKFTTTIYSAGGLVGQVNSGTISKCSVQSVNTIASQLGIYGTSFAGGIVGVLNSQSVIIQSYAQVTNINSNSGEAGGIVGRVLSGTYNSNPYINETYAITTSETGSYIGGVLGVAAAKFNSVYYYYPSAIGPCQSASCNNANPLTLAQLKQQASFVGWDFTNTWNIQENVNYPTLK